MIAEDIECENHSLSTHSCNEQGRYGFYLPFKKPPSILGNSLLPASRVLERMEIRFSRDDRFHTASSDFMAEALTHMEMVVLPEEKPSIAYYLPHHGLFNGSQKTRTGISLNDCLYIGPKLLPKLIDDITR